MSKRYFTGKPCKNGHLAERFVSSRGCVVCAAEGVRRYIAADPKRWQQRFQTWRSKNVDRDRAKSREWQAQNHDRVIATIARRKAALLQRTPAWADHAAIDAVYERCQAIVLATGIKQHVDHVIPLQGKLVSGLHVENNLAIIPAVENKQKSNLFEPYAHQAAA